MIQYNIYKDIQKNFSIYEFVDEDVYNKFGEKAWRFLDPRLLHTMAVIRYALGKPIIINNWKWNGSFSQRGLRTNISPIVSKHSLYLSAHMRGAAVDFDVEGMPASKVREWLVNNEYILPYKIRLERKILSKNQEINWVHLDVDYEPDNPQVYLFDV